MSPTSEHIDSLLQKVNIEKDLKMGDDMIEKLSQLHQLQNMEWFVNELSLSEGQSFGELALIHDKPRAATVVCEEDVVCGVINKQTY